jgi:hypothetical protein
MRNVLTESFNRGYAGCLAWEYGKQYTNTSSATSPYNPRSLDDETDWGDRFYMVWNPRSGNRVPAGYDVPLNPADRRVTGRRAVGELLDAFHEHLSAGRCAP